MQFDPRVLRLQSPEDCETFAENALRLGHADLAVQARQRAVHLRGAAWGAKSEAERECLQAVYAYEETLFLKHGKRIKASRTWQAIDSKGILKAVDDIVSMDRPTVGYDSLLKAGLQQFAFEVVVLKYPKLFSTHARRNAEARISEWKALDRG